MPGQGEKVLHGEVSPSFLSRSPVFKEDYGEDSLLLTQKCHKYYPILHQKPRLALSSTTAGVS